MTRQPQQEATHIPNLGLDSMDITSLPAALRRKAYELLDLAQQVEASLGIGAPPSHPPYLPPSVKDAANDHDEENRLISEKNYGDMARRIYQARRHRTRIFKDETLFGEPAWDIMLDLFAASCQNKRVAVTSACIGAAVPSSTALRWLKTLEDKALIDRESDASDSRRSFVRLSEEGRACMLKFFSEVRI